MADRRLRVFHAVAQQKSFTKAARELKMTQPAVTFHIKQMEAEYKVKLFNRMPNKTVLTEAGKKLLVFVERIFVTYSEMVQAVSDITGLVAGKIRIGTTFAIGDYMLPEVLANFKKTFPEIQIKLQLADAYNIRKLVDNNSIDIGICDLSVDEKRYNASSISIDDLVAIVPNNHELSNSSYLSVSELLKCPIILQEKGSAIRNIVDQEISSNYMSNNIDIALELDSIAAIKAAVESGVGVAIVPKKSVEKERLLKTLTVIDINPKLQNELTIFYQHSPYKNKMIEEFVNFSNKYFKNYDTNNTDESKENVG